MRFAVEETESARTLAHSKTWPRCQIYVTRLRFGVRRYSAALA